MAARAVGGWQAWALLLSLAGCSAPAQMVGLPSEPPVEEPRPGGGMQPIAGGQSGTDGQSTWACGETGRREVTFDEELAAGRGTAGEIRSEIERILARNASIALQWSWLVGMNTKLAIEAV